jgi:hypothetical protein
MHSPVSTRQIRTVLSCEADATNAELCEKATELTQSLWPLNSWMHSPVSVRQIRTVLSREADARSAESCEKATELTELLWPSSVCIH